MYRLTSHTLPRPSRYAKQTLMRHRVFMSTRSRLVAAFHDERPPRRRSTGRLLPSASKVAITERRRKKCLPSPCPWRAHRRALTHPRRDLGNAATRSFGATHAPPLMPPPLKKQEEITHHMTITEHVALESCTACRRTCGSSEHSRGFLGEQNGPV